MSKTKIYRVFTGMRERCERVKSAQYKYYGGRGIKCLWGSFEEFYADMGESYEEFLKKNGEAQLERINNNGNYCKKNCCWVTHKQQMQNTRSNIFLTYKGKKETIATMAKKFNVPYNSLYARLHKLGWSVKDAIKIPVRNKTK